MAVRIVSAIVAVILLAFIGWSVADYVNHGSVMVVPTDGVTAGGPRDTLPGGPQALAALSARTALQEPRAVSGPSPGNEGSLDVARNGAAMPQGGSLPRRPEELTRSWLGERAADRALLRERGYRAGITSLPVERAEVLEQPQGRLFRRLHNEPLLYIGGWFVLGVALLLALMLVVRGRIPLAEGFSGLKVLRFDMVERANHWLTATSGVLLALTGLTLLYGRYLIRPIIGADAYGGLASACVYLHIAFMPPFIIGVLMMAVLWMRENLPSRLDLRWLARFGGFFSNSADKPPARRFNAGQKLMFYAAFWAMVGLAISGFTLMFPFFWGGVTTMQTAQIVHGIIALLFIGLLLGHIWIGTVGMVGAFDAMWSGEVDRNWADEHHELWLDDMEAHGKAPLPPERAPPYRDRPGSAAAE